MLTADFDYHLPPELVAQHPVERGASRMLLLDRLTGAIEHDLVASFPDRLTAGDLLLLNDTRVIAGRLAAVRPTGRRFELLLLRAVDDDRWEALLRPAARARAGEVLRLPDGGAVSPVERLDEARWLVAFSPALDFKRLDGLGAPPLPPYIHRPDGPLETDRSAYQTVYAATPGAAAAPTAGLHFTDDILQSLRDAGVLLEFLTLHVGLGTFRPVQVDRVEEHHMHSEWYRFPEPTARAVNTALAEGRRVVCVGTTSVRALEAALAAGGGKVSAGEASTELFITPGFEFRGLGALLTNFHLPRSTLLMLVSAFAGREHLLAAYDEAIRAGYRFYSYGDAMLIV